MMSNLTTETYYILFASVCFLTGFILTISLILRGNKYRYFYYINSLFFFIFLGELYNALGIIFLFPHFHIIGNGFIIIGAFFFLPASDSISRDTIDPIKMFLYPILSMYYIFNIQNPDMVFIYLNNGMYTIYWNIKYLIGWYLPIAFGGCIYLYNVIRMALQSPRHLKRFSWYFTFGFLLAGFFAPVLYLTIHLSISGFEYILQGIGVIAISIVLVTHPQLVYILPFKAVRLIVMETNGGLPLFTHIWEKSKNRNNDLYSSMLQGVNLIFKESLNEGDVKEVQLSGAILMVHRSVQYPISFVLIAKKASKTLRDQLKLFGMKFESQFEHEFGNIFDTNKFVSAKKLVEECFPFVQGKNESD